MGFSCTLIFTRSSFLGNLFLSCLVIFSCKSSCLLLMKVGIGIAVRLKEILLLASSLRQHLTVYFESLHGWLLYISAVKNTNFSADGVLMRPGPGSYI